MDSRALFGWEQAKSERRHVRTFTQHSQLFHKHQKCASGEKSDEISNDSNCFYVEEKSQCTAIVQSAPEEIRGSFLLFSVGPAEFEDAKRIRADKKTIFLDEHDRSFQPRAVGSIDLILGTAVSFLVKVEQGVVEGTSKRRR